MRHLFLIFIFMTKLKCAVVGVGYLGRFHAQKYQQLDNAELFAVCDLNQEVAQRVGEELDVPIFVNYHELLDKVDLVSIAATTSAHFSIARDFLKHGVHVLIEKPITETVAQAEELIMLAKVMRALAISMELVNTGAP